MPVNGLKVPPGTLMLTAQGEIGLCDDRQGLHIDRILSGALAEHLREYLAAYRADPHAPDRRLAILYESLPSQPWGNLTLSLEDRVLRGLFPVGGRHDSSSLTAFQQKQREMSFYRGMEVLLEHQRQSRNPARLLCPVVYASPTTLTERRSALGMRVVDLRETAPALDVLNLASGRVESRLCADALVQLAERLRERLVRTHLRQAPGLALMETDFAGTGNADNDPDPFGEQARDPRQLRDWILPSVDARRLHETDRIESIERWLRIPHQTVEPWRLRQFAQFRELDEQQLAELVPRSQVYTAPASTRLLDRNLGDAWNLYLLDGAVMLSPADGVTLRIDSGSTPAAHPVAFLKPRIYSVDTLTPVSFLWVHDLLLQALSISRPVVD